MKYRPKGIGGVSASGDVIAGKTRERIEAEALDLVEQIRREASGARVKGRRRQPVPTRGPKRVQVNVHMLPAARDRLKSLALEAGVRIGDVVGWLVFEAWARRCV